jgi:hypothetical protein
LEITFRSTDVDITGPIGGGERIGLLGAADADCGLGICGWRTLVGLIDFDQPSHRIGASAAQLSRFIDRSGADALNSRGRLIIGYGAEAAILLCGLNHAIQRVILAGGDAIGRVRGGEVRIADRGHAPRYVKRGIDRGCAVGQEMLAFIGAAQAIKKAGGRIIQRVGNRPGVAN